MEPFIRTWPDPDIELSGFGYRLPAVEKGKVRSRQGKLHISSLATFDAETIVSLQFLDRACYAADSVANVNCTISSASMLPVLVTPGPDGKCSVNLHHL